VGVDDLTCGMTRFLVAAVRSSCIWGLSLPLVWFASGIVLGPLANASLAVLAVWGAVLVTLGLLLAVDRRARRRLRAWNRAWWSKRGRTAPPWCSYSSVFFATVISAWVGGGAFLLVIALWGVTVV
jgi:hypothetical protein